MIGDKKVVIQLEGGNDFLTTYSGFVFGLIKKYPNNPNLAIAHLGLGVAGEAGELADALKKVAIYEKPVDRANLVEELGDLNFFMEAIQLEFDISDEEIIQSNFEKLRKRYAQGYSDKAAQERADKKENHNE